MAFPWELCVFGRSIFSGVIIPYQPKPCTILRESYHKVTIYLPWLIPPKDEKSMIADVCDQDFRISKDARLGRFRTSWGQLMQGL